MTLATVVHLTEWPTHVPQQLVIPILVNVITIPVVKHIKLTEVNSTAARIFVYCRFGETYNDSKVN